MRISARAVIHKPKNLGLRAGFKSPTSVLLWHRISRPLLSGLISASCLVTLCSRLALQRNDLTCAFFSRLRLIAATTRRRLAELCFLATTSFSDLPFVCSPMDTTFKLVSKFGLAHAINGVAHPTSRFDRSSIFAPKSHRVSAPAAFQPFLAWHGLTVLAPWQTWTVPIMPENPSDHIRPSLESSLRIVWHSVSRELGCDSGFRTQAQSARLYAGYFELRKGTIGFVGPLEKGRTTSKSSKQSENNTKFRVLGRFDFLVSEQIRTLNRTRTEPTEPVRGSARFPEPNLGSVRGSVKYCPVNRTELNFGHPSTASRGSSLLRSRKWHLRLGLARDSQG